MIEIPSDLHPDLVPLAFLLGSWAGAGVHDFPGAEKCNFGQEIDFTHDGRPFLEYRSRTWVLDAAGSKVRPLENESGYWRIDGRTIEVVMTRDSGVAEVWYGELAEGRPQIDLATDAVASLPSAGAYSGGKRLYGYVKGDLMWVGEKATPQVPLRPYMSAHLKKLPSAASALAEAQARAEEQVQAQAAGGEWDWVKDIKDLPDDGIAFFK